MSISFRDFIVKTDEDMDLAFFNRRFQLIVAAIREAEQMASLYGTTAAQLVNLGLTQVNSVLGPILTQLQAVAGGTGFLVADSGTTATLIAGDSQAFTLSDSAAWAIFMPTPFLTVLDKTNSANYASLQLNSYNKTTGVLDANILYVHGGSSITSSSWTIACSGASLAVVEEAAASATASAGEAAASAGTASSDLATVMAQIAALELAIASGPVASVAGRTGIITLSVSDVVGLISALGAKLTASVNLADLPDKGQAKVNLGLGSAAVHPATDFLETANNLSELEASAATVRSNLGLGSAAVHPATDFLQPGTTATITVGYGLTPFSAGTKSSGTFTPAPASGNYQYATNNGAHTLAAPASDCAIDIYYLNGSSAGAITFSGFTVSSSVGDALDTVNTHKFIISIRRINSISTYAIKALQ